MPSTRHSPSALARQWCLAHPEWGAFEDTVATYLRHGFVWSSPRSFVLARAIAADWWQDHDRLTDHTLSHPQGDCWFLWLAAGDMREFFEVCPQPKPFVCFCRRGLPRLWRYDRINQGCRTAQPS
ncbi:MAG: hypothetical protein U0984_07745 [Prosthecobacter sp.]|nr:hypothetical protein [Prosthecobacter sp.]